MRFEQRGGGLVRRVLAPLVAAGFLLLGVSACDLFVPGPAFDGIPSLGNVTLHIENQSGLDIAAEVVYLKDDSLVRRTVRRLAASGVESVEEIIPTDADSIIVSARLADGNILPNGLSAGDLIQMASYQRGIDYSGDEVINFIIAAPPSGEPTPGCEGCPIFGDMNDDKVVDEKDVPLFIAVLIGTNSDPAARLRCDFNLDGAANGEDVQGFAACLLNRK